MVRILTGFGSYGKKLSSGFINIKFHSKCVCTHANNYEYRNQAHNFFCFILVTDTGEFDKNVPYRFEMSENMLTRAHICCFNQ